MKPAPGFHCRWSRAVSIKSRCGGSEVSGAKSGTKGSAKGVRGAGLADGGETIPLVALEEQLQVTLTLTRTSYR